MVRNPSGAKCVGHEQDRLAALVQISNLLGASSDSEELLPKVMEVVVHRTGAERGFLLLNGAGSFGWQIKASQNFDLETYNRDEMNISRAIIDIALESHQGVLVSGLQDDPRFAGHNLESDRDARSILCAPIISRSEVLGAIYLDNLAQSDCFNEFDLQFLNIVASQLIKSIENNQLIQAVQQTKQAKSKFVSILTHELRIPMTSIKGYADLLRQEAAGPINAQQFEFLTIIRCNVERMGVLVSDLSDISRIESGKLPLECESIPILYIIEETIRSMRVKLDEKEQILELQVYPDLPRVFADPKRLRQVLSNLINNACKYTHVGGKILVVAECQGQFVHVKVIDNGIGISPEDQAQLFNQFFRSEHVAVRGEPGWGLGLHIASLLVEMMGGKMDFSSTPGEGSTFQFSLPMFDVKDSTLHKPK